MNQGANIALVIIILLVIAGGVFFYMNYINPRDTDINIGVEEGSVCIQDVMQCPDGSYVGRIPPSCQFAPCPGVGGAASTSTSSNTGQGSFRGSTYTVKLGQSVSAQGFTITPVSVVEDSRCAEGTQCVWAGTVKVNVKVEKGILSTTQTVELNKPISAGGFTGELVEVRPSKKINTQINSSDYVFIFRVSN